MLNYPKPPANSPALQPLLGVCKSRVAVAI